MDNGAIYPCLRDCPVLITGGGTGIGAALVAAFAGQGAKVGFLDVREGPSEVLVEQLSAARHAPVFHKCDLTSVADLKASVAALRQGLGQFRVLINNAANDDRRTVDEITEDYWDWSQAVNVRHQFFAAQSVVPDMRANGGGAIVNFSSIAWMAGGRQMPAYSTGKAAVVGMTNALARDLGPDNIRVNAIAPGAVLTEKQRRLWYDDEKISALMVRQCLAQELEAEPVARAALFLASDDAAFITKQTLVVDAGLR